MFVKESKKGKVTICTSDIIKVTLASEEWFLNEDIKHLHVSFNQDKYSIIYQVESQKRSHKS